MSDDDIRPHLAMLRRLRDVKARRKYLDAIGRVKGEALMRAVEDAYRADWEVRKQAKETAK